MPAFFNGVFGHKPTTGDTWRRRAGREQAASCTGQTCCVSTVMGNCPMAELQVQGRREVPQPRRGMCSQGKGCAAWVFSWQQGCSARSAGVRGARLCQSAACPPCTCWYGLQTPWGAPLQAPGVALRNPGYRCCPEGAIENTAASLQKAGGTLQTPWGAPLQTLAVALQTLGHHCKPRGTVVNPQRGTANRGTPPQTIRAALQTSEHLYKHPRAAFQTCHMQPLSCSKAAGDCSPALLSPSCSSSTGTWHAVTNPSPPTCRSGPQ